MMYSFSQLQFSLSYILIISNTKHMLIIKSILIQFMADQTISQKQLTQEQLRQRRRQKILARATNNNQDQNDKYSSSRQSQQKSEKQNQTPKQATVSALEMFNASKRHSKIKSTLQMIAIFMGVASAGVHQYSSAGQTIFIICFLVVSISSAYLQVTKAKKVFRFTSQNAISDPMISKITNIKQLDIANKLMNIQASISPIAKLIASYLLFSVIMGCLSINSPKV